MLTRLAQRHPRPALLVAGLLLVALFVYLRISGRSYWDFNNVWAVIHLVWTGQSPADPHSLAQLSASVGQPLAAAVWGPQIAVLAAPLGLLDWQSAGALWFMLNVVALWGLVSLVVGPFKRQPGLTMFSLVLCLFFPPTLSLLGLGQGSLMIAVVLLLVLRALATSRTTLAGGLLTLGLVKPQLLLLTLPLTVFWTWRHARWLSLLRGSSLALLAQAALLTLCWPGWPSDYRAALAVNPQWDQPNLLSWLSHTVPLELAWLVWAMAVVLALLTVLWMATRSLWEAGLWALALTPLLAPYAWSWDFVLALPLFVWILSRAQAPRVQTVVGFAAICTAFAAVRVLVTSSDEVFVWVMPLLLLLCAWAEWQTGRRAVRFACPV